jgi:hypothetical protein
MHLPFRPGYLAVFTFFLIGLLHNSCGYRSTGNPGKSAPFKFVEQMSSDDFEVLDTSALYTTTFKHCDDEYKIFLKFSKDGWLTQFLIRERDTVEHYYRLILTGKELNEKGFYPSKGGRTKYYDRLVRKGYV